MFVDQYLGLLLAYEVPFRRLTHLRRQDGSLPDNTYTEVTRSEKLRGRQRIKTFMPINPRERVFLRGDTRILSLTEAFFVGSGAEVNAS